ncbi:substrate-binding family protein [Neorhizobium sp. R1-B]|nr:substrate-binding family protein [Neorhizobium sp. S3-V5DH]TDX68755.1 substrate-binding family protein [Neorhizobium sp. R1-B]
MPSSLQAADYSATLQYLKAVEDVGSTEPAALIGRLRSTSLNDMYVKNGRIREDGTMVHDMYLLRVKKPQESQRDWDFYEPVATFRVMRRSPAGFILTCDSRGRLTPCVNCSLLRTVSDCFVAPLRPVLKECSHGNNAFFYTPHAQWKQRPVLRPLLPSSQNSIPILLRISSPPPRLQPWRVPPEGHTHGATDNPRPTGGRAQAAEDAERHQRGDRHDECGLRRW